MQELVALLGSASVLAVLVALVTCALGLRYRMSRVGRALLVLVWVAAIFLVPYQVQPVSAQGGAGYAEYYVLGDEGDIFAALDAIPNSAAAGDINSYLSLVAVADGANVYLDEWEDTYDFDPSDPYNTADAKWDAAPGGPGEQGPALNEGGVLTLTEANTFVAGSEGVDGGDRLYITGAPVSVVRTVWPDTPGPYLAGSWELYPTQAWQNSYVVPVGEDLTFAGSPDPFMYTFLFIQAAQNNTQVTVTPPAGVPIVIPLNQGQNTYLFGINTGTTVVATDPIQAGLITSVNGVYDSRYYTLTPETFLGNEYYLPVPSMQFPTTEFGGRNVDTAAYIYAFLDGTVVNIETATGAEPPVNLDAGEVHRYVMPRIPRDELPQGSYGARVWANDRIWILVAGDDNNPDLDWGYQALNPLYLDDHYYLPYAPANPAHITPIYTDTTFFVDWDNDDIVDLPPFSLDQFETRMLYPPAGLGYDAAGAHIYANRPFAIAWGQDNTENTPGERLSPGGPDRDYGYTVLPLRWFDPVLTIEKTVDPPSLPAEGGTVTFTLVVTTGAYTVYNVAIYDELPVGWAYVMGSTSIELSYDGSSSDDPDISGYALTWDLDDLGLNDTMPADSIITLTYQARTIPGAYSAGLHDNLAQAYGEDENGAVFRPEDHAFVSIPNLPALSLVKTSSPEGVVEPGDEITYTICFSNSGFITATGVVITDFIPADTTYVADSVTPPAPPILPSPAIEYRTEIGTWVAPPPEPSVVTGLRWNIGDLVPGTTHCVSFRVRVADAPQASAITNTATIDSNETDPLDDTVYNPLPGFELVDPAIAKSGDPTVASPGEIVTFVLRVTNGGIADAHDVVVTDVMPEHLIIRDVTTSKGTVQQPIVNNTVVVDIGTIAGNNSEVVVVTIVTEVRAGTPLGTVMDNQASLEFREGDDRQSNVVHVEVPGEAPAPGPPKREPPEPGSPAPTPVPAAPAPPTPTPEILAVAMLPETGGFPGWSTVALGIPIIIGVASLLNLAWLGMRDRRGDGKGD